MNESSDNETARLELLKLRLEVSKHRTETAKWIVIALGAVASFWIIDRGKLNLERQKTSAEIVKVYLEGTEAPDPELWKRKLDVIAGVAEEERIRSWAMEQNRKLDAHNTLTILCKETLRIAARLMDLSDLKEPGRQAARKRFEELYWADLVYAREPKELERAMVEFKRALDIVEADAATPSPNEGAIQVLRDKMLTLAKALREAPEAPRVSP